MNGLKEDQKKVDRIVQYMDIDQNDPNVHVLKKKVAREMADEIALYKQGLANEKSL